jgi:hypothetical protein
MNALTSFVLVAFMSAFVNASGLRLRLITMSDQASDTDSKDGREGRELLSPWCDPATPVEWHP